MILCMEIGRGNRLWQFARDKASQYGPLALREECG